MKLALVHDALVNMGGAERVLTCFHSIFPEAPIYTTVYLPERTYGELRTATIRTTPLQKVVRTDWQLKAMFPLAFRTMRRLDLSGFDVVLSSSTFCAKNVETDPAAIHICYCHAPFRAVWDPDRYTAPTGRTSIAGRLLRLGLTQFQAIDFEASQKPQYIVANSRNTARKIEQLYHRNADAIIHPFVDVNLYRHDVASEDYFLVVSRLISYKRIDIVVKAFNELKLPLKVIGTGPDSTRLRMIAGPTIEFVGPVSDKDLSDYYARCRCLIFPGEEDFGLAPLEAHASGKPVIAFEKGGALETVVRIDPRATDSKAGAATGVFFREQTPSAIIDAVHSFEGLLFDRDQIRARAMIFDKKQFEKRIKDFVTKAYEGKLGFAVTMPGTC
jgi:glycosyltransferase involved in cell wall biosynthesis